jgi:alcohol dehydrogenase (NADP+)
MIGSSDFRITRMPLNHGAGHMPVLGFGTLIPDAAATIRHPGFHSLRQINIKS